MPTIAPSSRRPPAASAGRSAPHATAATPIHPTTLVVARGPQGPAAQSSDYGFIRYDEAASAPIPMAENSTVPFRFLQPVTIMDSLRSPFAGMAYLDTDGMTLRARKNGDSYFVRVRLSVVTTRAGGTFTLSLFVTGGTTTLQGANTTRSVPLPVAAGTSMRVDELYQLFPGQGFAANGALFQMTSTVPATVTPESLFLTPAVAAP